VLAQPNFLGDKQFMYAYSKDGAGTYKNIKLAREPWLGMTAVLSGRPYLVIDKEGKLFVLEGEDGDIKKLEHFEWFSSGDHNRLVAASRQEGSAFKFGSVIEDYLIGKLAFVDNHWYVRNGVGRTIVPIEDLADFMDAAGWKFDFRTSSDPYSEIKWLYLNDGELLMEDPDNPVVNHLALVVQQKGPEYVNQILSEGSARPIGIQGSIIDGKIKLAGPLSADPTQQHKAWDPGGSFAGRMRANEAVWAVSQLAKERGIPVDPKWGFNQVEPGQGMRERNFELTEPIKPIYRRSAFNKTAATFEYPYPPHGIHARTHASMRDAGLTATATFPDGYESVIPGPTAMQDMMRGAMGQDKEGDVLTVTTPDNPVDVVAILDALGGRHPDFNGVSPEVQDVCERMGLYPRTSAQTEPEHAPVKDAMKCPNCGSHTIKAMVGGDSTADMHCLTCGHEFKAKIYRNPESSVKEGMRANPDRPSPLDVIRTEVLKDLGLTRIDPAQNDEINRQIRVVLDQMGGWPHRALESQKWNAMVSTIANNVAQALSLPNAGAVTDEDLSAWPDTLPWGEAEQDYYRNARIAAFQAQRRILANLDTNVQQQILGLTQQIQQATQEGNTVLVQQLQSQLQQLLQQAPTNGTPTTPITPMQGMPQQPIMASEMPLPGYDAWKLQGPYDDQPEPCGYCDACLSGHPELCEYDEDQAREDAMYDRADRMRDEGSEPYYGARSDYDHWNEDADRMWWEEEGKHGDEPPDYNPDDYLADEGEDDLGYIYQRVGELWELGLEAPEIYKAFAGRGGVLDPRTQSYIDEAIASMPQDVGPDEPTPFHQMGRTRTANQWIKKRGDKWVIIQKGTGKVLSTHDTEEKAEAAFRAMMANKHGNKDGKFPVGTRVELQHQNYKGQRGSITEYNGSHPDLGDENYTILLDNGETITEVNESMFKKIKSANVDNSALGDSTSQYFLESLVFEAADNPFGDHDPSTTQDGPAHAPENFKNDTPDNYHAPEAEHRWDEPEDESMQCSLCGGEAQHLGDLGARSHYRCKGCGMDFSLVHEKGPEQWGTTDPQDLFGLESPTHSGSVEVGKMYTLHGPNYKVPDVVKILKVDGEKIEAAVESDHDAQFPFTIEGEGYRFDPYEQPKSVEQIEERLNTEGSWKLARRTFTPGEQRNLVDENKDGRARNYDKLNLEGTHYQITQESSDEMSNFFLWNE